MTKFIAMLCLGVAAGLAAVAMVRADSASGQDRTFVNTAANGGMMEVQLSQYATQNANNDDVKRFAQQMVTDHTAINDDLKKIASDQGLELPKDLTADDQKAMDHLEQLKGAEFDKAYVNKMVDDHKSTVDAFKAESHDGENAKIKDFVTRNLPTIQHHLQMAQDLQKKM